MKFSTPYRDRPMHLAFLVLLSSLCSVVYATLFDDIVAALQKAVDCDTCHDLLIPLQALAKTGDDPFISNLTLLCDLEKMADPDVCAGTIAGAGPILAHDLRNIDVSGQTATKLCDALFGLCDPPPVNPFSVMFPKAASSKRPASRPSGKKPFQVVHISDVHIDREYSTGSEANCTKPLCCRNFADQTGKTPTIPAGPNGNSNCDSPTRLANSMMDAIKQFGTGAKFTIFTGDVVDHANWLVDREVTTSELVEFNEQMISQLTRSGPVFPTLGNHDTAPVNAFPRDTTHTPNNTQWVFDLEAAGWVQWIHDNAAGQVRHTSGSYAVVVPGTKLRVLSINTQYIYTQNFWLYDTDVQQPDPNGIFTFAVDQLQEAEDAGERVWIIGHVRFGGEDVLNDQSNYFDQIVQRYKHTITGQFYGHSHKDQFQIAYSNYSDQIAANAVSVGFIAPSLTPTSGNPAFKIFDVDPDTFEVMDMKIFITNISDPDFQIQPTWELYYSARESYGPLVNPPLPPSTPLNAAFWHNLTEVFLNNNTAFQEYNTRISRGGMVDVCDDTNGCRDTTICDLRALRSENNCDVPTPGVDFKRELTRRKLSKRAMGGECEGHGIASVLSQALLSLQGA